jgi:hypothetical protein
VAPPAMGVLLLGSLIISPLLMVSM